MVRGMRRFGIGLGEQGGEGIHHELNRCHCDLQQHKRETSPALEDGRPRPLRFYTASASCSYPHACAATWPSKGLAPTFPICSLPVRRPSQASCCTWTVCYFLSLEFSLWCAARASNLIKLRTFSDQILLFDVPCSPPEPVVNARFLEFSDLLRVDPWPAQLRESSRH